MKTPTILGRKHADEQPTGQINGADRPIGPTHPVPKLKQPGRSRRPLMLALMVVTIVIGALSTWWLVQKSTERTAVIGMAHDVPWGQLITAADLVQIEVVADPALKPVDWDQRSKIIGQRAASDLSAGTLLTPGSVTGMQVPAKGSALVGVLVMPGQMPVTALSPQDSVLLVPTGQVGAAAGKAAAGAVPAEVFTVGAPDASGARTVDVLVTQDASAEVVAQAAAGQIAIVLVSSGR